MKDFIALQNMAGTYIWQSPYLGEESDTRQQGVRFSIQTSSLVREAALTQVAADLADLGENWLHPMGAPDGPWMIHLDKLPQSFSSSLVGQTWLRGDRAVEPEFDIMESSIGGNVRRIGFVRVTLLPENRALFTSVPSAPELAHLLFAFRRDYPDSTRCGFLMMPFTETPAHRVIAKTIRDTCMHYGLRALRADDHRYSDELLPNIRTYMHGCGFGIAVFERLVVEHFNPNVSLEVGYMLALGKPVCLLKDKTLTTLPSDLVGRLYENFDVQRVADTLPEVLARWLRQKGLVGDGG